MRQSCDSPDVIATVGAELSYVILNWDAAMLFFPPVNVSLAIPAPTSTVTLPPDGVISAVKTGLPAELKSLAVPLPTVISPISKFITDSLNVIVIEKGELFVGSLSADVIDNVNADESYLISN